MGSLADNFRNGLHSLRDEIEEMLAIPKDAADHRNLPELLDCTIRTANIRDERIDKREREFLLACSESIISSSISIVLQPLFIMLPSTESPIERIFVSSFFAAALEQLFDCRFSVLFPDGLHFGNQPFSKNCLTIEPQAPLGVYRIDFKITYTTEDFEINGEEVKTKLKQRCLLVECDGHEFHEKTKEQAAHDKSRDRELQSAGYHIFRFTGSEIWRDPVKCAHQCVDYLYE